MIMRVCRAVSVGLLMAAVLAGPWLFGAWETWWFWPFTALLFAALVPAGLAWTEAAGSLAGLDRDLFRREFLPAAGAAVVFLAYGAARMLGAEVYTDAERSFLLFFLPFAAGLIVCFGAGAAGRRLVYGLLLANILALGVYGLINHHLTGSTRVMWMPGYEQYYMEDRASGSYYCPNHYAGILELGAALAAGLWLDRRVGWRGKLAGALMGGVAVWGVLWSRSRGGGLALLVMAGAAAVWGLGQWRPAVRRRGRLGLIVAGLAVAALFASTPAYRERFLRYPWQALEKADRVQMVAGALRAWRTAPVIGIGPGMHQNLWPHFAASPDGDRARRIWPSRPNANFHSYEVHSDWVQMLEEYGAAGLALFLLAAGLFARLWRRGLRREAEAWSAAGGGAPPDAAGAQAALVAGVLAVAAMAFHQAVDFNLQMPATGWVFGAMLGLATAEAIRARPGQ